MPHMKLLMIKYFKSLYLIEKILKCLKMHILLVVVFGVRNQFFRGSKEFHQ